MLCVFKVTLAFPKWFIQRNEFQTSRLKYKNCFRFVTPGTDASFLFDLEIIFLYESFICNYKTIVIFLYVFRSIEVIFIIVLSHIYILFIEIDLIQNVLIKIVHWMIVLRLNDEIGGNNRTRNETLLRAIFHT